MKKLLLLSIISLIIGTGLLYYYKDDVEPTIEIINSEITLESEEEYNYEDNIQVTFGKMGGKVEISSELIEEEDKRIVNIFARGNNTLVKTASYTILYNNTTGRDVLFVGDSILDGYQAGMYSYGDYIGDNYDFNEVIVAARSGACLTPAERCLNNILKAHQEDEIDYDFVILEGGINDILALKPIGELSDSFDPEDLNIYTYIGAFEYYLYQATTYWPNARIGYLINYYTQGCEGSGYILSKDHYAKRYELQKQACEKWGVEYLDLFDDYYCDYFEVSTRKYLCDHLHLNTAGQTMLADVVYNWMKHLARHSSLIVE